MSRTSQLRPPSESKQEVASFTTLRLADLENNTLRERKQDPGGTTIGETAIDKIDSNDIKKKLLQPVTVDHLTQLRVRVRGHSADDSTRHSSRPYQVLYGFKSFEFEVVESPAPGKRAKQRTGKENIFPVSMPLISFAKERRRTPRMHNTTPPATSASVAPHTFAMSCYGYDSQSQRSAKNS